jgi:hypothetical protein
MVRLFVRSLRRCYAVSDDRMTLTISCYQEYAALDGYRWLE